MPRLPTGERGSVSFPREETRRRLIPPREDKASHRSRVGRCTVPPGSGRSAYRYPVGLNFSQTDENPQFRGIQDGAEGTDASTSHIESCRDYQPV
ncbi:hypothetical protein GW17_00023675, partial [Ensete ventricosum]